MIIFQGHKINICLDKIKLDWENANEWQHKIVYKYNDNARNYIVIIFLFFSFNDYCLESNTFFTIASSGN